MTGARGVVRTTINPAGLEVDACVTLLNRCFGGGWDRRTFHWYCARSFAGEQADLLVRAQGELLLAGISLACREVRVGDAPPVKVGMLGAAATLPEARGAGHYGALLLAAIERARQRGCVALVSFATQQNGSWRGLQKLGAAVLPSAYLSSIEPFRAAVESRHHGPAAAGHATRFQLQRSWRRQQRWRGETGAPVARFHYPCFEDWRSQFMERPSPVQVLRPAADCLALVETVQDTDRLQWLDCPPAHAARYLRKLAEASAAAGRHFFAFTMAPHRTMARATQLAMTPGWLILQPTGLDDAAWRQLAGARWRVHSGDRL